MRIAYRALTGRVDSLSTLESVGRRGRGLEPKGGPPASWGADDERPDTPRVPADAGYMSRWGPRVPAVAGNRSGAASGKQRTSERLMSTGSAFKPRRFRSSSRT